MASLGRFPTPVERAEGLGEALGGLELWLKRDDASGDLYGGNKVRKLELLLGKAMADGRRRVVTTGAYGSHHVLATSVYAREVGLETCAVLGPQPVTPHVLDNLLAAHGRGATLVPVRTYAAAGPRMVFETARRRAMLIPPGGSSALGALAYAGAALELAEQVRRGLCPEPERLYVALGSSGTMAGLVLGVRLAGLGAEVVGVRVTPLVAANEITVAALSARASLLLSSLAPEAPVRAPIPTTFRVVHDQYGPGYGHETAAASRAMSEALDHEGLALDPTYTGKAMAGLIADCQRRPPSGPVLFWSTLSSRDLRALTDGVDPRGLHPALARLFQ